MALPIGERVASLNNEFFIDAGRPLPHLDQGPVHAYAASGSQDVSHVTHFAMVCEPHLTPRIRGISSYNAVSSANVIKLAAAGIVYWGPARAERFVFIYENSVSKALTPHGDYRGLDWRPETVQSVVVKPMMFALMDLRDVDIAHGNIRPSNMYPIGGAGGVERVMLGECLSAPAGSLQPVIFEPIERAMADPTGRGPAHQSSDLYALGVSLAVIMRSRDPMEGMTNDEIIKFKIEQGSYQALTGKDRFTGGILELLRGLLQDDLAQRWTLDDLMSWMDGQRLTPKQGVKKIKAARPIHFLEERYLRPAMLAMDLQKNQSESAQLVESGTMEQWISRSLEDSTVMKRLESAIETTSEHGRGPGYWDRMLCRVSIALDPEAPIRYRGLSLHPEGFGSALAEAMIKRADIQPFADLINHQTIMFWLAAQTDPQLDIGNIVTRFDSCRAYLRQPNIAYGIERCLYFLNPEVHCLSEKLRGFYVSTPEDIMYALEKISTRPGRPDMFFDRHIIAFLCAKDRKDADAYLMELNSDEAYKRILGNIKVLATIQQRGRMEKFPGICKWIIDIVDPVYERFHDRELRVTIKQKVAQAAESGDITKIAGLLDTGGAMQSDTNLYNQARVDYYNLRIEASELEEQLRNPGNVGKATGREIAALIACIISGATILFFVFMFFSKGSAF